jgi:hypothetical protein
VTSLSTNTLDARAVDEDLYWARGDMENRIKEQQLALFADRTSTHARHSNQLRLYFSSFAHVLMPTLRHLGLKGTALAKAQGETILLKLFKIGAHIRLRVRRLRIAFSESYPYADVFRQILHRLQCIPLRCSRVLECMGSTRAGAALSRSLTRHCQSAAQRIKGAYPPPHGHKLHSPADGPLGPCPRPGYSSCFGQSGEKCGLKYYVRRSGSVNAWGVFKALEMRVATIPNAKPKGDFSGSSFYLPGSIFFSINKRSRQKFFGELTSRFVMVFLFTPPDFLILIHSDLRLLSGSNGSFD